MANRFTVEAVFKGIDRISAPVSRIQNRVGKFTRSFSGGLKKINRGVDGMSRGLRRMATVGVIALAATSAAFANVITTGAKFEQTLVSAAAKFPSQIAKGTAEANRLNKALGFTPSFIVKGTEEFKKLQDAAAEVGRTTEFTATQSAEALNFLAMAGFNAESAIAALPGVVDLATVGQLDLGRATDIATDSLGAFNLLSKDAATQQKNLTRVSDLLVKTSISANTSIEDMFEAMKQGAPIATAAGQSIETTATLIALMANAGIKGSRAGTGLKRIMEGIGGTNMQAAKTFELLKIKTIDSNDEIRDAVDVFTELGDAINDMPSSQRLAIFTTIFGERGKAGAINIANMGEGAREFKEQLQDIEGVTKKMALVMRDTFEGRMNSLKSAIESVKISIFGLTEGPLADTLDRMVAWVRANEQLIAGRVSEWILLVVNNLDRIIFFLKRVGVGLIVFFSFIAVLKTLIAVLTVVNLLMTANPIVLITLAIIALIAALVLLIFFWDEVIFVLRKSSIGFKLAGLAIIGIIAGPMALFKAASEVFAEQWESVQHRFTTAWRVMVAVTVFSVKRILGLLKGITESRFGQILGTILSLGTPSQLKLIGALIPGGSDEAQSTAAAAQVVSPSERTARSIEEHSITNTTEVTLRTEAGTSAEVTKGRLGGGIKLQHSAGF